MDSCSYNSSVSIPSFSLDSGECFISEDREVKLISDVDSLVPEKFKKLFSLIEEVIETNKETLPSVFKKIEESGESINFISSLIEYALKIRPLNEEPLLSLNSMLSRKYGCKNSRSDNSKAKRRTPQESEMLLIFKEDDLDSFIKKSSEIGFDPKSKIEVDFYEPNFKVNPRSSIAFVLYNDEESYIVSDYKYTYLQAMAFYGAIKCFKHACLTNDYDLYNVDEYAVAGGNMEIIHILEQMDVSFECCLEVSIKFHRNELSDWILINNKCLNESLSNSCSFFNYRAAIFGFKNGIDITNALTQAAAYDQLDIVKYLYESCHAELSEHALNNALENGHLDIVKYLHETCRSKVNNDAINLASSSGNLELVKYLYEKCRAKVNRHALSSASLNGRLEVVKYLYGKCHANVESKVNNGNNPIINASRNGHLEVVKYLYETCHANVETFNNYNNTPINLASENGHLDIVKYLYETCRANVETKDIRGNTPINLASKYGHLEVVKYLYEKCHADIEIKDDFNCHTPINLASENGYFDIVKYLYETCHAEITEEIIENSKTKEIKEYFCSILSDKPLDFESDICEAAAEGKLASVQYLIEICHANVETRNEHGETPMSIASENGYFDIIKYLYETCRAEITEEIIENSKTKEIKKYFCSILSDKPLDFESDICEAAAEGKLASVQYLIERYHANVETRNEHGETPMSIASENGHLDIVKYLYETCHAKVPNESIFYASRNSYLDIVKYLYETCHAKVPYASIFYASKNGQLEVVKYLYETCHENIETKDFVGRSPLHSASRNGRLEIVKYLYETCHADVKTKDDFNYTPIACALENGHLEVAEYLYKTCRASVETKNYSGCTPINWASRNGHLEVVKFLYETCHAKVETKDKDGYTPISNATRFGHLDVVEYLHKTCHV